VHRNKFHHSLRNVNISSENHSYRLTAFWSYESVSSNLEEDENNNNASQYHLFWRGGRVEWGVGGEKSSQTSLHGYA